MHAAPCAQASFKQEVAETFLRCVADGYDPDLAVIELNGLKIAEHRVSSAPSQCWQTLLAKENSMRASSQQSPDVQGDKE